MLRIISLFGTIAILMMAETVHAMTAKPPKTYKELMEMDSFKYGEEVIRGDKETVD